jgi:integrase
MARSRRGQGTVYRMKGSRNWYIAYSVNGKRVQKATGTPVKSEAETMLRNELLRVGSGEAVTCGALRVKELYPMHVRDWTQRGKPNASLKWQRYTWENHLLPFFGEMKVESVGTPEIQAYVEKRLSDVPTNDREAILRRNGTINRELTVLSSAFSMAYKSTPRLVPRKLEFERLMESRARQGFIEEAHYQKLLASCAQPWLQALLCCGFRTGMRKGELLALKVEDIDLFAGFIRVRDSKNGEPRSVPIRDDMRPHLIAMIAGKQPTDAVFTRPTGARVVDFRSEWHAATKLAGLDLIFHDLRRSAVRALSLAGVNQVEAMAISGHKTPSMFKRYNIVDEARLRDAARKADEYAAIERKRAGASEISYSYARVRPRKWSGRRESNPHLKLGKLAFCH